MKLNIGCGPFYLKGYINIDPFQKYADKSFYAWDFPYSDESVEKIVAFQLLEHLGYIGSIYSLSEWYRVLKNHGQLIIETVFLEKSLNQKPINKNWLFGQESLGMTHKYCFHQEEIINLLKKIGFNNLKLSYKNFNNKPILRIEAQKIHNQKKMIIAQLRKKILSKKIINIKKINHFDYVYEEIFEEIIEILSKSQNNQTILSLLKITAIFNPKVSFLLFSILQDQKALTISQKLIDSKFINFLSRLFFKTKKATGMSNIVFQRVKMIGQQYIEALYKNLDKNRILPLKLLIFGNFRLSSIFKKINHFSILQFKNLSSHYEALGVKYFAQEKFPQAKKNFNFSVGFNADNFFSYWNLARLYLIEKNIPLAIINYEKTFETAPKIFKKELKKEIRDITRYHKIKNYLVVKENVYY